MTEVDLAKITSLSEVEQVIGLTTKIISALGFNDTSLDADEDRQVIFDNQELTDSVSLSLSVVLLPNSSRTFNFEYRSLPGKKPPVYIQDRGVKSTVIQMVEGANYKQLSIQVYFLQPINYQSEDLIYRVKVENTTTGPRLKTGFSWLSPQQHMPTSVALDLTKQIYELFRLNRL